MKWLILCSVLLILGCTHRTPPTAVSNFRVGMPDRPNADALVLDSPFGINNAFGPNMPDRADRLHAMQQAGIKWGRQDFTWSRIEVAKGVYNWEPYDRLVEECHSHGLMIFGNLAYNPKFIDPCTPEGVQSYAAFARAAAARYKGKVDYWQIWNEPNGGFWKGTPEQYAAILAAAGKAIHEANPSAKVLGLNMAFCDVIWAERILKQVPYDCLDIVCFHPYRVMCAPEDKFDWWQQDQYVNAWHKDLGPQYPLVRMSFLEQTDELVKVMEKFGQPKPLWITEICWNTNIHPYGTPEIRQADMLVRFYVQAVASRKVQKIFWWTLKDGGDDQFDMGDMVGMVRSNYEPKYSYYAYAFMTHMLEGKKWVRNESFGPTVYEATFHDDAKDQDIAVVWATKPYAYVKVANTEKGLTFYDVYGTRRFVPFNKQRTANLTVPVGESPIYIVAPTGLKVRPVKDPGW